MESKGNFLDPKELKREFSAKKIWADLKIRLSY
jgi:hypothetical protein